MVDRQLNGYRKKNKILRRKINEKAPRVNPDKTRIPRTPAL
jgi:hypothetical protein